MRLKPPRFATLRKADRQGAGRQRPPADVRTRWPFQAREAVPALIVAEPAGRGGRPARNLSLPEQPAQPGRLRRLPAPARHGCPTAIRGWKRCQRPGPRADVQRATEALVYLHRVRQDWPAARESGRAASNPELQNDLAWEADDWKTLAERRPAPGRRSGRPRGQGRVLPAGRQQGEVRGDDRRAAQGPGGRRGGRQRRLRPGPRPVAQRPGARGDRRPQGPAQARRPTWCSTCLCAQLKFKEAFAYADAGHEGAGQGPGGRVRARPAGHAARPRSWPPSATGTRRRRSSAGVLDAGPGRRTRDRPAIDVVKAVARAGMRDLAAECAARGAGGISTRPAEGTELTAAPAIRCSRTRSTWSRSGGGRSGRTSRTPTRSRP